MSESRLERVRAVMPPDGTDLVGVFGVSGAVNDGGLVADDATVRWVSPNVENVVSGPEGFIQSWADWLEPWQSYRISYDDIVERGDRVVILVRFRGVTQRDGVEVEHEAAAVFRFEGDQVVEIEFNLDREDALAD
jgi:ketosteroid isomerase-like protein